MRKLVIVGVVMLVVVLLTILWRTLGMSEPIELVMQPNTVEVFPQDDSLVTGGGDSVGARVKARYANFLVESAAADNWTTFSENGRIIPLQTILTALGAKVEPNLSKLIDQQMWQLYTCTDTVSKPGVRDIVLSMRFALQPAYQGNLYADQMRGLLAWEQSLLVDVLPILYPQTYYVAPPIQTSEFVTNANYPAIDLKQATVQFGDTSEAQIGYIFVGDELLVGTNEACLLRAQEILYDTSA